MESWRKQFCEMRDMILRPPDHHKSAAQGTKTHRLLRVCTWLVLYRNAPLADCLPYVSVCVRRCIVLLYHFIRLPNQLKRELFHTGFFIWRCAPACAFMSTLSTITTCSSRFPPYCPHIVLQGLDHLAWNCWTNTAYVCTLTSSGSATSLFCIYLFSLALCKDNPKTAVGLTVLYGAYIWKDTYQGFTAACKSRFECSDITPRVCHKLKHLTNEKLSPC